MIRSDRMRPVPETTLNRWRQLSALDVLQVFAEHSKLDRTFVPTTAMGGTRWHASVLGVDFELILNGPKFWDCRSQSGGGGAVDLVMHLTRQDFRMAARLLEERNL